MSIKNLLFDKILSYAFTALKVSSFYPFYNSDDEINLKDVIVENKILKEDLRNVIVENKILKEDLRKLYKEIEMLKEIVFKNAESFTEIKIILIFLVFIITIAVIFMVFFYYRNRISHKKPVLIIDREVQVDIEGDVVYAIMEAGPGDDDGAGDDGGLNGGDDGGGNGGVGFDLLNMH